MSEQYSTPVVESKKLSSIVDSAFNCSLASLFLSGLPVACFVSFFLGIRANKLVKKAEHIAEQTGEKTGWEHLVSNILGKIGFYRSIAFSAYWTGYILFMAMYFFLFFLILILAIISEM